MKTLDRISNYSNIPAAMRDKPRWVCHRLKPHATNPDKQNKVPWLPSGKGPARSNEPADWTTFEDACRAVDDRKADGITYMLAAANGLVCIDLDNVRDLETGTVKPEALAIVQELDSYTEISPSGTGLHVWVNGSVPKASHKAGSWLEIYADKKAIATTGDVFVTDDFAIYDTLNARDLTRLFNRAEAGEFAPAAAAKAAGANQSDDDFALMCRLVREFGCDEEKVRAAFLAQAVQRPKLNRADYVDRTFKKACAKVQAAAKSGTNDSATDKRRGATTTRFSDIQEAPMLWLWPHRIPKDKIVIFGGNPDSGKSLQSIDFAARLSTGSNFADGAKNEMGPIEVAMLFCEDDAADTVKPRLLAAGADCTKIHRIQGTYVAGDGTTEERHIAFDTDLPVIEEILQDNPGIRFLVIDPISSYLGEANMVKETDVRRVLIPLAELAARLEVTVLLIAHLNKRSDVTALNKIMGAVALSGVARAAWMFAADPEDEDGETYLMVRGKLNVGKKTEGLRYAIHAKEIPICGSVPFIKWLGTTTVSAGKALGLFDGLADDRKGTKSRDAEEWLADYLAAGPKPTLDTEAAAFAAGIKERTLATAKKSLGVKSQKQGDTWFWCLPGTVGECKMHEAL